MAECLEGERDSLSIAFINEVYDNENALETFEMELERALEAGCDVIVVEPSRLGDETARWIAVGNCLHRTATLSGLGSLASAFIWSDKPYVCAPMCLVSLLCAGVYTLSWQFDPCVYYQVQTNVKRLIADYPALKEHLSSSSPVVLVRKDVSRRNRLQTGISLLAAVVCVWRLHEAFKDKKGIMPQEINVLQCYKCVTYQAQIVKKSKKWTCSLCGEKQSIKRTFGVGSGKACRELVQKLNTQRHEAIDDLGEREDHSSGDDAAVKEWADMDDSLECRNINNKPSCQINQRGGVKNESRWTKYLDEVQDSDGNDDGY